MLEGDGGPGEGTLGLEGLGPCGSTQVCRQGGERDRETEKDRERGRQRESDLSVSAPPT